MSSSFQTVYAKMMECVFLSTAIQIHSIGLTWKGSRNKLCNVMCHIFNHYTVLLPFLLKGTVASQSYRDYRNTPTSQGHRVIPPFHLSKDYELLCRHHCLWLSTPLNFQSVVKRAFTDTHTHTLLRILCALWYTEENKGQVNCKGSAPAMRRSYDFKSQEPFRKTFNLCA